MKARWKKKWLAALRSGEYRQGREALRQRVKKSDAYCCLGVLADLVAPEEWSKKPNSKRFYRHNEGYENLSYGTFEQVGLDPHISNRLVDMNDSGQSFTTIAAWIEKNL